MRDVFAPFAAAVTRLEGEYYATISEVYPILFSLKDKLEQLEVSGPFRRVLPMLRQLKRNLDHRFTRVYVPTSFNFDPLYMLATYLDPRYALLLEGELLQIARRELKLLNENGRALIPMESALATTAEREVQSSHSDDLLSSVRAKISERRSSSDLSSLSAQTALDVEQGVYVTELKKCTNVSNIFDFWSERKERLPLMYDIAVDVLSVPATTAPVERVFSRASYILSKKRHNLSDEKLEIEMLCKFNSEFATL